MELVIDEVLTDPLKFQKELQKVSVPRNLCHMSAAPAKEDVVAAQTSNFNLVVPGSQQAWSQHSSHEDLASSHEDLAIPVKSAELHMTGLQPLIRLQRIPSTNIQNFDMPENWNVCNYKIL